MDEQRAVAELDSRRALRLVRRHVAVIVLAAIALGALGFVVGRIHKSYTTTAVVRVAKPLDESLSGVTRTSTDDERAVANELQYLTSTSLRDTVEAKLALSHINVTVAAVDDSDVVRISATASSARQAARIANGFAAAYVDGRTTAIKGQVTSAEDVVKQALQRNHKQLALQSSRPAADDTDASAQRQALVNRQEALLGQLDELKVAPSVGNSLPAVVVNAVAPSTTKKLPIVTIVLGVLLGILLGLLIAALLENARGFVVDEADVAAAGILEALVVQTTQRSRSSSTRAAALRQIAPVVMRSVASDPSPAVMALTMDNPNAAPWLLELGRFVAALGKRVVVIDAEPVNETSAGGLIGLSDVITGASSLNRVIRPVAAVKRLTVIAPGVAPMSGPGDLAGVEMQQTIAQLAAVNDLILIGVTSPEAAAELSVTGSISAAVCCVVARRTTRARLASISQELANWGTKTVAVMIDSKRPSKYPRIANEPLAEPKLAVKSDRQSVG